MPYSNLLKVIGWVTLLCFCHGVLAKDNQTEEQAQTSQMNTDKQSIEKNLLKLNTTGDTLVKNNSPAENKATVINDGAVIQLAAIIRGNQQQPKILTIVPWQSPGRRNALPSPVWQQVKQQLRPIERRNFLQEQRLFEKLSKQ